MAFVAFFPHVSGVLLYRFIAQNMSSFLHFLRVERFLVLGTAFIRALASSEIPLCVVRRNRQKCRFWHETNYFCCLSWCLQWDLYTRLACNKLGVEASFKQTKFRILLMRINTCVCWIFGHAGGWSEISTQVSWVWSDMVWSAIKYWNCKVFSKKKNSRLRIYSQNIEQTLNCIYGDLWGCFWNEPESICLYSRLHWMCSRAKFSRHSHSYPFCGDANRQRKIGVTIKCNYSDR